MQKRTTIFRAASMLGGLSAVVVGATFAAAAPVTATLTNSSLVAATTSLVVDGPDANLDFGNDDPGFTFNNLLPGSENWSAPQDFSLRNTGSLDLKVAVSTAGGTGTLDKSKVHLLVKNVSEDKTTEYTLDDLDTATDLPGVSGDDVLSGNNPDTEADETETDNFTVQVKLDAGASSQLTGLNFVFNGLPVEELED
jgi:hypothetical protein